MAFTTKSVKKPEGPVIVSNLSQLTSRLAGKHKGRVILSGSLVAGAVGSAEALSGMVVLPARDTKKAGLLTQQRPKKFYLGVDRDAIAMLVKAGAKVSLGVDVLIKYGQKTKADELMLVCMTTASDSTGVTVLRLRKGEIEELQDFCLVPPSDPSFEADVISFVERLKLKHPSATLGWCSPSPKPSFVSMMEAPTSLWNSPPLTTLSLSGKASAVQRHGLAVLLVAATAVGTAGAIWLPYTKYEAASAAIKMDNAQLKGDYTFATERLTLLRAFQSFYRAKGSVEQPLKQFADIVYAAGQVDGLRIQEARVNWPGGASNRDPLANYDFVLTVEMPKHQDATVLEQSVPLLRELSSATGASMRLAANNGMREIPAVGDRPNLRVYIILGNFYNGS